MQRKSSRAIKGIGEEGTITVVLKFSTHCLKEVHMKKQVRYSEIRFKLGLLN